MKLVIRAPVANEADALTDLCLRAKASWGNDAAFMAASRAALTVTPKRLARDKFWVAERNGRLAGVAAVAMLDAGPDLDLLFVDPDCQRAGIGCALLDQAVTHLRTAGACSLTIQSDPGAEMFYVRYGAKRIGETPSEAIPGRMLPLLVLHL